MTTLDEATKTAIENRLNKHITDNNYPCSVKIAWGSESKLPSGYIIDTTKIRIDNYKDKTSFGAEFSNFIIKWQKTPERAAEFVLESILHQVKRDWSGLKGEGFR